MLYDVCRYFLCFIFFSFLGWAYEVLFYSVQLRKFVNSGFLHGCICPVYGFGGLILIPLVGRITDPRILFFFGMIVCSILEYITSWVLEEIFDTRWWDYSHWPLNINGRICIVSMLGFGFATLLGIKIIIPQTLARIDMLSIPTLYMLSGMCAAILLMDLAHTLRKMEHSKEKLWFIDQQSKIMESKSEYIESKLKMIKNMYRNLRR